jgi:hypothetical protein
MLANDFQFCAITRELLRTISVHAIDGRGSVLLGPAYGGKTVFMRQLQQALQNAPCRPKVLSLVFKTETPIETRADLRAYIDGAVHRDLQIQVEVRGGLLEAIKEFSARSGNPVIMLASSVDGMAYHLLRDFLTEAARLSAEKLLTVVLTGEAALRDILSSSDVRLLQTDGYVVQGFGRLEFEELAQIYLRRAQALHMSFEERISETLWYETGGSDSLLAWIFWVLLERALHGDVVSTSQPVNRESIEAIAAELAAKGMRGANPFILADRLLSREPACWLDLAALAEGKDVPAPPDPVPGPLEISGVAVRMNDRLHPASPMMAHFLRRHYTTRRLADFYGRIGDWDTAFRFYGSNTDQPVRPLDPTDRAEVATNVVAFRNYLNSMQSDIAQLPSVFANGCRYLLGFREVTFWERASTRGWLLQRLNSIGLLPELEPRVRALLPDEDQVCRGEWQIGEPETPFCIIWCLETEREDRELAVVLGDMTERRAISKEQREFALSLLQDYARAHEKAVELERERSRKTTQEEYSNTIRLLLSDALASPSHVLLSRAAERLRRLRYKRVLFSRVSPDGRRIKGVLDDCDDTSVKIDRMTDYGLDLPIRDIQPWVVLKRTGVRIRDASREPLANRAVVEAARIQAFALVPIFGGMNSDAPVMGTIHIERADGGVPSIEEVSDLEKFGRQLGIVLKLADDLRRLEAALYRIPDPVLVVDGAQSFRLLNSASRQCLAQPASETTNPLPPKLTEHIVAALTGVRRSFYWPDVTLPTFQGTCEELVDQAGRLQGAVLFLRNAQETPRLINALTLLRDYDGSDSAGALLLRVAKRLGRPWGRFFKLTPPRTDLLKLEESYGDKSASGKTEGPIFLTSRTVAGTETWEAISTGRPMIFEYDPDGINGQQRTLANGLLATCVSKLNCPPEFGKVAGDFWLDLPVFDPEGRELGKVTLEWSEAASPAEFYFLEAVTTLAGKLKGLPHSTVRSVAMP